MNRNRMRSLGVEGGCRAEDIKQGHTYRRRRGLQIDWREGEAGKNDGIVLEFKCMETTQRYKEMRTTRNGGTGRNGYRCYHLELVVYERASIYWIHNLHQDTSAKPREYFHSQFCHTSLRNRLRKVSARQHLLCFLPCCQDNQSTAAMTTEYNRK